MEARDDVKKHAQHLTFSIDGDVYGVAIQEAREIIRYQDLTRVPVAPAWVRGVVNLRGSVVPVLDLKVKLGGTPSEVTRRSCIVVLDVANGGSAHTVGLLADQVNEVKEFANEELSECPSFGLAHKRELLCGLGRQGDNFVLLLDVQKLLEGAGLRPFDAGTGDAPAAEPV